MSYLVLARKWRPQTFRDIVGQQTIAQTLANSIKLNRIGHAFLFSGPRGIGKTSTARILAKALNCETGPTPEPCNVCVFCKEITTGKSLDVLEIDGASNRGIDEIRELRENVKYAPASTRFKIIIIDEVHMLTREAFNALLKTLEEPPPHVKFILATTELHKVPITIVSRCQRYDFKRIDIQAIADTLNEICEKEKINVKDKTISMLARMADGSMRDGLSLLDQVISFSGDTIDHERTMQLLARINPETLKGIFSAIAGQDSADALMRFSSYVDSGGDELVFAREMMEMTRDILAAKVGADTRFDIPKTLPEKFSVDQIERIFKILLDLELALKSSDYPRLIMDVALVKMSRIKALTPIKTIMEELRRVRKLTIDSKQSSSNPGSQTNVERAHPISPSPLQSSTDEQFTPVRTTDEELESIINAIPGKHPSIKEFLNFGVIMEQSDSKIVIGFKPENCFQKDYLNSEERCKIIENAVEKATGKQKRISIKICKNSKSLSPAEKREEKKKKRFNQKLNAAMSESIVSELTRRMDGRIRYVKIREDRTQEESK